MTLRTILNSLAAGAVLLAAAVVPRAAQAQDHPARRLSSIVGVAVEEYGKAVDSRGALVSDLEYGEAVDFLGDARKVAARLSGPRADQARLLLDSLSAAVGARRVPDEVAALHQRFTAALGSEGALELPTRPIDLAQGERIYQASCASCHGQQGLGDGPAGRGLEPAPPAVGVRTAMLDRTPAIQYRILSVGVAGTAMAGYAEQLSADQRWNVIAYLERLRATEAHRLEGEGRFVASCVGCHGATGAADGAFAAHLTRLPPEIGSFAWQAERSDEQILASIRAGVPGTAMPAFLALDSTQGIALVSYVRALATRPEAVTAAGGDSANSEAVSRRVVGILDDALGAARGGRASEAGDKAFDAYIAFEPLESRARAKNPGAVASMERLFADFKAAASANDLRRAERARDAIAAGLPQIVELTRPPAGGWGAFLQSFLIILREGFEAILVVGAVVTFLVKTGHREKLRSIWLGVGAALVASAVMAVVLKTVLANAPASREVIEGLTMLVAVAVLFSVSYWLISKVEAAKWQQFIRDQVNAALSHGGGRALATVAFLAVFREGAETALFYQALFQEGGHTAGPIVLGILVGAVVLAGIFTLFYRYGVKLPLRPFFAVTSGLLYYMAFVFLGKGLKELQEGNAFPATVLPGWPHVEALGLYPTVQTLLAQLVLLLLLGFALVKTFWPKRSVQLPTREPIPTPGAVPAVSPAAAGADDAEARIARLTERLVALQARVDGLEARAGEGNARSTAPDGHRAIAAASGD